MSDETFGPFAGSTRYRDAATIVDALAAAGHVAYFAGGCVRDALLGREPKDYDVATSATPDAVRACFRNAQGVGESFGVMLIRQPSSHVEVATFRSDGVYSDGRRPDQITFASEADDARRRDFTVNGMFYEPRAGRVIDHVGGRADLASRVIRAIGEADARFAEDYLRLLRAVRFAARLDFTIEPATQAAIVTHATKLTRIAPERVADEMRRMLTAPTAVAAVEQLDALGLLRVVFRRVEAVFAVSCPPTTNMALGPDFLAPPLSFSLALTMIATARLVAAGVAFASVVTPDAARRIDVALRETLRYSNDESSGVRGALALHRLLDPVAPPTIATLKRFLARPHASDARRLLNAFAIEPRLAERVAVIDAMIRRFGDVDVAPTPFVGGDDLAEMGFPPSPTFKRVLDATYDAQLEDRVTSRDAALAWAHSLMTS